MHVDFGLEWFFMVLTYPLVDYVDFIHYLLADHPSLLAVHAQTHHGPKQAAS